MSMVNWQEAERHLAQMGVEPDETVTLALFPPKVGRRGGCAYFSYTPELPFDVEQVEHGLSTRPGYSLGFIPNPGGTRDAEIRYCRALFFEDDSSAPIEVKQKQWEQAGLPHPSLQIWTGGKSVHHYWLLTEPCTPSQFRAGQRRLFAHAARCLPGSDIDTALCNPARILRLAGGVHPETGQQSKVLTATGERFEYETLWELTSRDNELPSPPPKQEIPSPSAQPRQIEAFAPLELRALPDFDTEELEAFKQRQETYDFDQRPNGLHYARLPHSAKREVLIDALRFCPQREEPGSNTYPKAFPILAALVNAVGAEEAAYIAKQANWSTQYLDIDAATAEIEQNTQERGGIPHKSIYFLFDTAEFNGWPRPWSIHKQINAKSKSSLDDDELLAELRQCSFKQWSDSRAAHLQLSSVFHPRLARFLGDRADAFPVAHTAMLAPFITTMASVLGTRYSAQIKTGWKEPMVFWMGTVAPASSLKTPVANQFLRPLQTLDTHDQREYKRLLNQYKAATQNQDNNARPPELPRQRVVMDATFEGLCSMLERESIPGLVSFHDELSAFIGDMDKYRSNSSDRAHWLSMFNGGAVNVVRKSCDPILVDKTAVSLFGGIQQDKLASLLGGEGATVDSGDGFWARFLWVTPPYVFPAQNMNESDITRDLHDIIAGLDAVPARTVAAFDRDAWELFREVCDDWSSQAEDTYAARAAFIGKLRGYLARFAALLLALDRACELDLEEVWAEKPVIDRQLMERAVLLTKFFLCQFDVLAPQVGGGDIPGWVAKVVSFGETVETKRVTARDLVRKKWAENSAEAREMLQNLVHVYGVGKLVAGRRRDQTWWQL